MEIDHENLFGVHTSVGVADLFYFFDNGSKAWKATGNLSQDFHHYWLLSHDFFQSEGFLRALLEVAQPQGVGEREIERERTWLCTL